MVKSGFLRQWLKKHHLAIILLLASAAVHFVWLGYPAEVVFDEVHFGKFVTAYCCTKERFFDIHPPHAKLFIAGTAYLLGYRGGLSFTNIGDSYGEVAAAALRFFPAAMGTLLPWLVYVLLLKLKAAKPTAVLGGMMILFDNAVTAQTRIVALDGLMLVSILGALIVYLTAEEKSRDKTGATAWWLFGLAGGLAGLAVGTKFTGLTALALLVILLVRWCFNIRSVREIWHWLAAVLLVCLGALLIYAAGWLLHFAVLQKPGSGDAWRVPQWTSPLAVSFYRETMAIQKIMYRANSGLTATHPYASYWWTWPIMQRPVFYWQDSSLAGGAVRTGFVYFIGNPLLWWGSSVLFIAALLAWLGHWLGWLRALYQRAAWRKEFKKIWQRPFVQHAYLPLLGYFIAFVPLMRVTRALFLYHYLTSLFFAVVLAVIWLQEVRWIDAGRSVWRQPKRYYIVLGAVALFFLWFSPLTYGFNLPPGLHQYLFWFKTWR